MTCSALYRFPRELSAMLTVSTTTSQSATSSMLFLHKTTHDCGGQRSDVTDRRAPVTLNVPEKNFAMSMLHYLKSLCLTQQSSGQQ